MTLATRKFGKQAELIHRPFFERRTFPSMLRWRLQSGSVPELKQSAKFSLGVKGRGARRRTLVLISRQNEGPAPDME